MLSLVLLALFFTVSSQYKLDCVTDADCPVFSTCLKGKSCMCNTGYVDDLKDSLNCLQVAGNVTDKCEEDIQCKAGLGTHAHCFLNDTRNKIGECRCLNDSHYINGLCYQSSHIGDRCNVTNECVLRTRGILAYCEKEKCVCPPGHKPTPDHRDCRPELPSVIKTDVQNATNTSFLGALCTVNDDCTIQNSECYGVCRCRIGFAESIDKRTCLPAADQLGLPCIEDGQCTEYLRYTGCLSGSCSCASYAHVVNRTCWMTAYLGNLCERNEQCLTISNNRSTYGCVQGVCACYAGFKSLKGDCASGGAGLTPSGWLLSVVLLAAALKREMSN